MQTQQTPLTNLQLEILKVFSLQLTQAELMDIRTVLARHFADRLTQRVDRIWQAKGLTAQDMDSWLNEDNQ
ncbi:hypothetical protein U27_03894 [Candidatus Vecturithrix granuli]|uniref:Uncharacterized protein n=1 Tax=Vecturithrix granuli TaxID=1499967 RepID=A0A081BX75_VECG1|nr:hypothetical protein U27_03894 [Candidatus Vecturithrix granuli]